MLKTIIYICIFSIFITSCSLGSSTSRQTIVYVSEEKVERYPPKKYGPSKPYTIALIPKVTDISYFKEAEKGAKEAASDLGVNVIFAGSSVGGWSEQKKVIEDLITQKVDVIAVSAFDPFKLLPVLKKARDQNIKVITWDSDTDPSGREFFVSMVESEMLGRHIMDTLASKLNEKGEFAIITSSISSSDTSGWIKWIKIQQNEYYPNMKLVRIVACNDNYENAYNAAKNLLIEYSNLSAIVGISSVAPPAAAQAVLEMENRKPVRVSGLSLPNSIREYINKGIAEQVTFWSPQQLGYLTVVLAKNMLDGEFPQDQQYIPKVGNIRVKDKVVVVGEPIEFTKDNIDQYDF